MSGLKPPELNQFFASLKARDRDVDFLACAIGVSRPALTRVLNGSRRWGPIGRKVEALLTPEELRLLDVAHRSPWNARRVEKRPRWTPKMERVLGSGTPPPSPARTEQFSHP